MIRRRKQNNNDNNQSILKEILEELRNMNQNITQKLDTMNQNITQMNNKLDTLEAMDDKLGQIIRITKLHRAELSEYSLFMSFKDDYVEFYKNQDKDIKVIKAEIEDIKQGEGKLRDFVVEVGNGERRKIYIEVKTAISEKIISEILEKFKNVEGEKWVLARCCDSDKIKLLTSQGINVYTYDEPTRSMKMFFAVKNGQTGQTGKTGQTE